MHTDKKKKAECTGKTRLGSADGGASPGRAAFGVAVAPAPGEYKDSEGENCYRKGVHIFTDT